MIRFLYIMASTVGFILCFTGCFVNSSTEQLPDGTNVFPTQMAGEEMVFYVYDKNGNIDSIVRGQNDYYMNQEKEFLLTNFRVIYYGKDENENPLITQLTSNYGKLNTQSKDFEAWGNVIVIKENDSRIMTNRIFYNQKNNELSTPKGNRVVIQQVDGTITEGVNLVADRNDRSEAYKINLEDSITYTPNTIEKKEGEF